VLWCTSLVDLLLAPAPLPLPPTTTPRRLRTLKATRWGDSVTIVNSDMRTWSPPELADIMVSELLGSFGDNELSPECLDGAQRLLKPGGVCIPCEYTSYLAPLMSSKLWNEVKVSRVRWRAPSVPLHVRLACSPRRLTRS